MDQLVTMTKTKIIIITGFGITALINAIAFTLQSSGIVSAYVAIIALISISLFFQLLCRKIQGRDEESRLVDAPRPLANFFFFAPQAVVILLPAVILMYSSFEPVQTHVFYWTLGYSVLAMYVILDPILTVLAVPKLRERYWLKFFDRLQSFSEQFLVIHIVVLFKL